MTDIDSKKIISTHPVGKAHPDREEQDSPIAGYRADINSQIQAVAPFVDVPKGPTTSEDSSRQESKLTRITGKNIDTPHSEEEITGKWEKPETVIDVPLLPEQIEDLLAGKRKATESEVHQLFDGKAEQGAFTETQLIDLIRKGTVPLNNFVIDYILTKSKSHKEFAQVLIDMNIKLSNGRQVRLFNGMNYASKTTAGMLMELINKGVIDINDSNILAELKSSELGLGILAKLAKENTYS